MLTRFEARTPNLPCFIEQFDPGLFSAAQLWKANVGMFRTIANDVDDYEFPTAAKR